MTATFPNGIASFTKKRDNVDTNYAADINRIQDEVVAIENTLGALINNVTTFERTQTEFDEQQTEFDKQETIRFENVDQRLQWLQSGQHLPAFSASVSNVHIYGTTDWTAFESSIPSPLKVLQPAANLDPFHLWTPAVPSVPAGGGYFTLNKSGFWVIQGAVRFITSGKNGGTYQAAVDIGGNWYAGADRKAIPQNGHTTAVMLNPTRIGWFNAGSTVILRASQTSADMQTVATGYVSGICLREM